MDDLLELILTFLFPEAKFEALQAKINSNPNPIARFCLKLLLWLIPLALIFALSCALNRLIKGYWI